jgi:DNA mismatch endonuclease, patch repair protein
MDRVTKEKRSQMMSGVRSKDTGAEITIRKALFRLGIRYGLHSKSLPGCPDIVLRKYRTVVFVNGCFWHMHGCPASALPKTRTDWWAEKILHNKERDILNCTTLLCDQWRIAVIWDCALKGKHAVNPDIVAREIADFLHSESLLMSYGKRGASYLDALKGVYYE